MMRVFTAVARRIIRDETFDSLVAPALADLQFAVASARPLAPHYIGLVGVFATALARDARIDFHLTFSAGQVWKRAAAWCGGFILLNVGLVLYYAMPWHLLDGAGRVAVITTAFGGGILGAIRLTMVPAAFHFRRQSTVSHRTITMAMLWFASVIVVLQIAAAAVSPAVNQVILDSASRVIAKDGRAVLDARTPFSGRWKEWLETVRTRAASPATPADGLGTALRAAAGGSMYLIPYALFGVVLSRGRGWTVLFRTVALIVTSIGANLVAFVLTTIILRELSPDYQTARAFVATLFVALMWLFGARIAAATIQAWREVARFAVPVRFD
jgi:hypothetical protein